MAHALAPKAKVILVEAASNSFMDLFNAEVVAANAVAAADDGGVTNSWGSGEFPGELTSAYTAPFSKAKVVVFASTGDDSTLLFPAVLPTVAAAGGTNIVR